jgi:hypothetical protein
MPVTGTRRNPGGRRRSVETMRKDAEALRLHCQGMGYQQIADELHWRSKASAFKAVKNALADLQRDKLEQVDHFTAAVERIQKGLRECQEIIDTPHYLAGRDGKIVTMWNEKAKAEVPVLDSGPKQRAVTEMRHLNDQLIMLMDLRPAAKSRVEVVTEDVVDAEIAKLAEELAVAGKDTPVPGQDR